MLCLGPLQFRIIVMVGLRILLEEVKGNNPGKVHIVGRGTIRLGRRNSDIEINNDRISGMHAEIHYSGTRVFIIDRNSTNGTFVNGSKVRRVALKDGDVISLGGISEKASAVFKLKIEGELKQVVYVINRSIESRFKYFYLMLIVAMFLFFVWLIIPTGDKSSIPGGGKPWENAETLMSYPITGSSTSLVLGDTVSLPTDGIWKTEVRYELIKDDGTFEPRLYFIYIYNDAATKDKVIESSVTVQRFKSDFNGNVEKEQINNFIWHEKTFLKENGIDKKFIYSKTKLGVWQWVLWQDPEKFNLYASCVTQRGRVLVQAAAFDVLSLKRFFQYLADTYQEGTANPTNPN